MTKSEKRYFRQYAERHKIGEKNNYLALFDAIMAQSIYDEAALKITLQKTSYVSYFSVAKRYLYQQILESLHLFYQTNSIQEKIKKQLHFSIILSQKGLLDQAETALNKSKKWINDYQLWEYKPLWMSINRQLMQRSPSSKILNTEDSYNEEESALIQLQEMNWYWKASNTILELHYQKVKLQDKEQQDKFNKIIGKLLKKGVPEQLRARLNYYKSLATAAFMNGNYQEAYQHNKNTLELFEENPTLVELEPQLYLAIFYNFLIDNFTLKKYDIVEEGIMRLRELPLQKQFKPIYKLESKIFAQTYALQLNARIAQNRFEEALDLLPGLEKGMLKHKKSLSVNYKLQFYYLMAYILFDNQSYKEAITCLDEIRSPEYKDVMEELVMAADRLYILAHYELENYLFLDSLMIGTKRKHKKKKRLPLLENVLFKYIKKVANPVLSRKELKSLFKEFEVELMNLKADPAESRAWVYFDFDRWMKRKV